MKKLMWLTVLVIIICAACGDEQNEGNTSINQRRDPVAVATSEGVFISWKLYLNDPLDIAFNVYRNGTDKPLNSSPLNAARTNFLDKKGGIANTYQIEVLRGKTSLGRTPRVDTWANDYLSIKVERPVGYLIANDANHTTSDGTNKFDDVTKSPYTAYEAQDGVMADLDGDGVLDLVFFWGPENRRDNSNTGRTAVAFIDAYRLDGTKVWGEGKFINCGPNIRSGNHYNTFVVDDFDNDGKAEIIFKSAPLTFDTEGHNIGLDMEDLYPGTAWNIYLDTGTGGKVVQGPEYLTVFDGATGKALDTVEYLPGRGSGRGDLWGDSSANRVDRFLACSAFLDGVKPSAVMCRGYYIRTALAAWDLTADKKLKLRWFFDTRNELPGFNVWGSTYERRGNHNLSVSDVDGDGRDDIIYGSMVINSFGIPLHHSGMGHGDALHVGDFNVTRPGLEVVTVQESAPFGIAMYDARTGQIVWRKNGTEDTGRGLTADIDPDYLGSECWANSASPGLFSANGDKIADRGFSNNMAIYWDGDTGRELFDGGYQEDATVRKVKKNGQGDYSEIEIKAFPFCKTNSGTKRNPILQLDIFGDWREEIILRTEDNTEIRIYTTTIPTVHEGPGAVPATGIPALMDNHQYRMANVWQNTGYNQPPHTSWFIGYYMDPIRK